MRHLTIHDLCYRWYKLTNKRICLHNAIGEHVELLKDMYLGGLDRSFLSKFSKNRTGLLLARQQHSTDFEK
jgi:hypothetical protein